MTGRRAITIVAMLAATLLAGCSTPATRVILLPQADGRPSAVVVRSRDGEETLSQPFQRATTGTKASGAPKVDAADPARLKAANRYLFELMPAPAQHYTVYFDLGGAVLTAASRITMNEVLVSASARSAGDIVVTGHTDTTGPEAYNDALSLRRAQQVRHMLLERGFPQERIEAVGRGERDLAVPTRDAVDEPRNRRVTIDVR